MIILITVLPDPIHPSFRSFHDSHSVHCTTWPPCFIAFNVFICRGYPLGASMIIILFIVLPDLLVSLRLMCSYSGDIFLMTLCGSITCVFWYHRPADPLPKVDIGFSLCATAVDSCCAHKAQTTTGEWSWIIAETDEVPQHVYGDWLVLQHCGCLWWELAS